MLATLGGTKYLARGAVNNAVNIRKTKQYIKNAFEAQMRGEGSTMVEILSQCPTNWAMDPQESVEWVADNMIPFYKLGEIKNELDGAKEAAK
jgi:2-oxoglutarate ferredoxin oxidoreductase subunit beta